jgi:hypothetical protein
MNFDRFITMVNNLKMIKNENLDINQARYSQSIDKFLNEFGLLNFREFHEAPVQVASQSPR